MEDSVFSNESLVLGGFGVVIFLLLALDIWYFRGKSTSVSNKEAVVWSGLYIGIALIFGLFVYWQMGKTSATEYWTAYLIEEALSVDNLFVFILIFGFFKVPAKYQHKVLFWGIFGAVVFRAIFIFSGVWLINLSYLPMMNLFGKEVHINILLTIFGIFLVYAGIASIKEDDKEEKDFSKNFGVRIVKLFFPIKEKYDDGNFFTKENGKRVGTLLLLVVGVIEATDLIFAVDSIPAIFSVSKNPFILYTSNIFAILGLRTLYFLLANTYKMFVYLKYGLAVILSFIGVKMVIESFVHIPSSLSLGVVAGVLIISVLASLAVKRHN